MIPWSLCLFCCRENTVLTAVAFLPVLNSGSLKAPLSFFALRIVFALWVSSGFRSLGDFFFPFYLNDMGFCKWFQYICTSLLGV